jgi:hypothetical protein
LQTQPQWCYPQSAPTKPCERLTRNVQLVFQPLLGSFAIDDVCIDPYRR